MSTKATLVTPDLAATHLDIDMPEVNGRQLRQRHVSMEQVKRWSDLMRAGKFYESPQGPAFAPNGAVLDGMHRMLAIVDCGIPQTMRVTFDCPPELFPILDNGRPRTAANVLQVAGHNNSSLLASTIKLLHCYGLWLDDPKTHENWISWNRLRPENSELDDLTVRHSGAADVVSSYGSMARRVGSVPSAFCAFVYLAQMAWPSRNGLTTLDEFLCGLDEGIGLKRDTGIYTTREWLRRNKSVPMTSKRERHLMALLKGWEAHATGVELRLIRTADKTMPKPYQPAKSRNLRDLFHADTV